LIQVCLYLANFQVHFLLEISVIKLYSNMVFSVCRVWHQRNKISSVLCSAVCQHTA